MKHYIFYFSIIITSILSSCSALTGEEIGRLKINEISTENNLKQKTIDLNLEKGEKIAIWSEMDMKYEGDIQILFILEVQLNNGEIEVIKFDPRKKNISINEVKTDIMGKVNWSFKGKNTSITIKESGAYHFKGILIASDTTNLTIKKAEIVFKK